MSTETFAPGGVKNGATLSFHPSYSAREFGVDYDRRYHEDPVYRIEQDRKSAVGCYERFGEYGMGDPDPKPVISVGIQPLDFMNVALGGRMFFSPHESVWTPDKPLAGVQSIEDIEGLGNISWEDHPLYQDLFRQIDEARAAFPDMPVVHVQGVWLESGGNDCMVAMHTPYTTAFRLMGERIFEVMLMDEEVAKYLLEWLMKQYKSLWSEICNRMGWRATKIHLGDCAATMMSPSLYEIYCVEFYRALPADYDAAMIIHSCGPSSHLLELFAQVPRVAQLQLGDGTDLKLARSLFSESSIVAYYSPAALLEEDPGQVESRLWDMCEQLEDNFTIACGAADPNTPEANIRTFLDVAKQIEKSA